MEIIIDFDKAKYTAFINLTSKIFMGEQKFEDIHELRWDIYNVVRMFDFLSQGPGFESWSRK